MLVPLCGVDAAVKVGLPVLFLRLAFRFFENFIEILHPLCLEFFEAYSGINYLLELFVG